MKAGAEAAQRPSFELPPVYNALRTTLGGSTPRLRSHATAQEIESQFRQYRRPCLCTAVLHRAHKDPVTLAKKNHAHTHETKHRNTHTHKTHTPNPCVGARGIEDTNPFPPIQTQRSPRKPSVYPSPTVKKKNTVFAHPVRAGLLSFS